MTLSLSVLLLAVGAALVLLAISIGLVFVNPDWLTGLRALVAQWRWEESVEERVRGVASPEGEERMWSTYSAYHRYDGFADGRAVRPINHVTALRVLAERSASSDRLYAVQQISKIVGNLASSLRPESEASAPAPSAKEIAAQILEIVYGESGVSDEGIRYSKAPSHRQLFEILVAAAICMQATLDQEESTEIQLG